MSQTERIVHHHACSSIFPMLLATESHIVLHNKMQCGSINLYIRSRNLTLGVNYCSPTKHNVY